MLTSCALILLSGMMFGTLFKRMHLPAIIGMIAAGILISPNAFNLIDESLLEISSVLRQVALVIILTRAGLTLDISDLRKIGRPAILMSFVPACFEILGTMLIAPVMFDMTLLDAALMGSVIAAVSPAVVVPRMINLIEQKKGTEKGVPQLILAGASVDDVFVIVVFTALCGLCSSETVSLAAFAQVPVSIVSGVFFGAVCGVLLSKIFEFVSMTTMTQFLLLVCSSFLLLEIENLLGSFFPFSALLAIMSMALMIRHQNADTASSLKLKYNAAWIIAEIFLFVLVGINVDMRYALSAGGFAVVLVLGAMIFRMSGVAASLVKTSFNQKERLFCMLAYTPKATVQAAIGAIPLAMGLECGELIMTVSVISILLTAPFGAICIDHFSDVLLGDGDRLC